MTELNTAQTLDLWAECRNADPSGNGAQAWNRAIRDLSISAVSFQDHQFNEAVDFDGYRFPTADFREATFTGEANFSYAKFSGGASFGSVTFEQDVNFSHTTFTGKASFGKAACKKDAE
ncbi:MAG: pentapeptide repeat-containing protein, partial [Gammaproteobacteria bacterium]